MRQFAILSQSIFILIYLQMPGQMLHFVKDLLSLLLLQEQQSEARLRLHMNGLVLVGLVQDLCSRQLIKQLLRMSFLINQVNTS